MSDFLKNNTKHQPAWQEIVDFSYQASWPPTGRIRRSFGTPRDLINRIPYQWREDHLLIAGCGLSIISDFSMRLRQSKPYAPCSGAGLRR